MTQILKIYTGSDKVKIFDSMKQENRHEYIISGNISAVEGVI